MENSGNVGSTTAVGSVGSLKDLQFEFDKSSKGSGSLSQLLAYPPLLGKEHDVHSAPPTVYDRYRPPASGRKDSREIFDTGYGEDGRPRETLLSFPSVTDSGMSQDWSSTSELNATDKRMKGNNKSNTSLAATLGVNVSGQRERSKERSRERSSKKYPGAGKDVDEEESESLWRRSLENESEEGGSTANHGIRLVPSRK
jgi:hypothetical protein